MIKIVVAVALLACVACYPAEEQKITPLKLANGDELKVVDIVEKVADGVSVKTVDGVVKFIKFSKMTNESKVAYGYNPEEENRLKKQISASAKVMKKESDKKRAEAEKAEHDEKLNSIKKTVVGSMIEKIHGGIIVECDEIKYPRAPKTITTSTTRIGGSDPALDKVNNNAMDAYNKRVKELNAQSDKRAQGRIFIKDYPEIKKLASGDKIECDVFEVGVKELQGESLKSYSCNPPSL
jgi:hypothetical protein